MATPSFKSGRGGTVTVGGNALPITRWNVNPDTRIVRFDNSQTGRFGAKDSTMHDCKVQIDIDWDSANNPFAAPLNIVHGTILTNVVCTVDGTSGWTFPSFIVSGTPQELVIDGKNTLRVIGENNGPYTMPGGISPPTT